MRTDEVHENFLANGKFVIKWITGHCAAIVYKGSTITNTSNDQFIEQSSPRYILGLLLLIITVSVKTVDIMNSPLVLEF
jgi:predicted helicase